MVPKINRLISETGWVLPVFDEGYRPVPRALGGPRCLQGLGGKIAVFRYPETVAGSIWIPNSQQLLAFGFGPRPLVVTTGTHCVLIRRILFGETEFLG